MNLYDHFRVKDAEQDEKALKVRNKAARAENKHRIGDAYYTQGELAAIVGCSKSLVCRKLKALREVSGPITLERLRA